MTIKKCLFSVTAAGMLIAGSHAFAQDIDKASISYVGAWSSLSLYKHFERPFWEDHIPKASGGQISTEVTSFDQMGLSGGEVFLSLIHISEPTRRTPISYAVFC